MKIDKFCAVYFTLLPATYAISSRYFKVTKEGKNSDMKHAMTLIEYDLQNIMDAKNTHDNEGMEAALYSFYGNRKTLREKGVDEDIMKDFDHEVDTILEKPDVRLSMSDEGVKEVLESINQDVKNVMEAKNSQDKEDMEAALVSFYRNRKTLDEIGFDPSITKDFDEKVDSILMMSKVNQDEEAHSSDAEYTMGELMDATEYDVQNIIDARNIRDDSAMDAALNSFYAKRKILKARGVDKNFMKDFDDKVHAVLIAVIKDM